MQYITQLKWTLSALALAVLAACGGGGGDAGTPSSGPGANTGTTDTTLPVLSLQLLDASGTPLSAPVLSQTETRSLRVTLKNAQGQPLAYSRVSVELDNTELAALSPASGATLTDANGVALFTLTPKSVSSQGAVRATVKASADGKEVTQTLDLQINAGSVALGGLSIAPTTVQQGQSVNVNVNVSVNGQAATSNSVAVAFTSTCGTVSPASALVDNAGKASAVVQTNATGSCVVSAATTGAATVTGAYTVTAPPVTGVQFVSANPPVIYQQDSPGARSSQLTFKVVDANGQPVQGENVSVSLVGNAGGVNFCNAATSGVSAAGTGEVTFSVCGGTQPTTVQVRAQLGNGIYTDSNILTVQTGLPTQRFFDLAVSQQNFHVGAGFTDTFSGNTIDISVFAADRQGNPVPDGTPVTFVTEGGQINSGGLSSCVINNGSCSVQLIGQDYRPWGSSVAGSDPRPGRVTVLAMADGEESFVDANSNNRYDPKEDFEDLGEPFLDKNENGAFNLSFDNLFIGTKDGEVTYPVPLGAAGGVSCLGNDNNQNSPLNIALSEEETCNGEWNGSGIKPDGTRYAIQKVRRAITVVFSGGDIGIPNELSSATTCTHDVNASSYNSSIPAPKRTQVISCNNGGIKVQLADLNGNPLPAGSAIAVKVRQPEGKKCAATLSNPVIGSTTEPTVHTALLEECSGGESVDFSVTVTSGAGSKTSTFTVTLPPAAPAAAL
jgi:hypothetical protein